MSHNHHVGCAVRRALIASALAASAVALAHAQDTAVAVEEVVVTGSRINRPDLEASSPVAVVSAQDFKMAGTVSAEEFLRDLPQLVPAVGSNSNNGRAHVHAR